MNAPLASAHESVFAGLRSQPSDPLLALIDLHRADPRNGKIDLGVGVYRDDDGATPVMAAVKAAEAQLHSTQPTKAYLGAAGDEAFVDRLAPIVFGAARAASDRLVGMQTAGGTGALRLGADLIARARPAARVWIGAPTWPNHAPIFHAAGLAIEPHPYFDATTGTVDFDAMLTSLAAARPGDVLLLHGCCHNPTGADLSREQWDIVATVCVGAGLVPFIDLAYQGLGDGLDVDAAGCRRLVATVPEALIAYSCDKNFGLYRERVGALWALAPTASTAAVVRDNMLTLARAVWSMPPDHGAAVVRLILEDDDLAALWRSELEAMRHRLTSLRQSLAWSHPRLEPIRHQRGLFSMLSISRDAVATLREQHGIYMADSGRINIAGLRQDTIGHLVEALSATL